jgi:type II secretory ATPase GspE/PulE/Tfp pilus assembly ATPase PilB-like protein
MLRLVARIKLVAAMDPTDRMRPQDGRLRLRLHGRTHDVRISTVPANGEEKLVARILGGMKARTLQEGGLRPARARPAERAAVAAARASCWSRARRAPARPRPCTARLSERNDPGVNISTVEDPVEIRLPWLAQIEVNTKADLTFASALRSVLRQDPTS